MNLEGRGPSYYRLDIPRRPQSGLYLGRLEESPFPDRVTVAATDGGVRLGRPDDLSRLLPDMAPASSDDRVWPSDWPAAYDLSEFVRGAPRFPDRSGTPRGWPCAYDLSRFRPGSDFMPSARIRAPRGWPRVYDLSRFRSSVVPAPSDEVRHPSVRPRPDDPELIRALQLRSGLCGWKSGRYNTDFSDEVEGFIATVLVLPRSERWYTAVHTALVGGWSDPLLQAGELAVSALAVLKAEARTLHRQAVPLWCRRTRHGRVLSLDADLGGLSLYDLVASDADLLGRTFDGVFEDERLNVVLRCLDPEERRAVFAYAEGEGITWAEAAAVAGVAGPEAFGERVRRKVKRLAAEQRRRTALRQGGESSL